MQALKIVLDMPVVDSSERGEGGNENSTTPLMGTKAKSIKPLNENAMHKYVLIEDVQMSFATRQGPYVALKDIDLKIARGEFITLIGHSGCGKSTYSILLQGCCFRPQGL